MAGLGSCNGPISGEHIISEAVLRLLAPDGEFSISGFPWLEPDETKIIGPQALRVNCLCVKHNSALHPLDDAAKHFIGLLKAFFETEVGCQHAIISGHDLERWLLKTAKAMAVSRNFASGRERLSGKFRHDVEIVGMIERPDRWPDGCGLYCVLPGGSTFENHPRFQTQPLTNDEGEIEAVVFVMLGIHFVLALAPLDKTKYPFVKDGHYRPGRIIVSYPSTNKWVTLSWEDDRAHEHLTVHFLKLARGSAALVQ